MKVLILLLISISTFGQRALTATGSTSINFPLYTNTFIPGTSIVLDRRAEQQYCNVLNNFLTFTQVCGVTNISGYMRLSGLSTINDKTIAIVTVTANHASVPIGPWTAAEAQHFGVMNYVTDADNNYLLMISPAASAVGERDIQLVKQVAGIETILDTDIVGTLQMNTEYILEIERVAGVLTGVVREANGTLISTVSAADTSLSTGETGAHGYATTYTVRALTIE